MRLAVEWRARRWRGLLNAIDRLPRDSAFVEALSQDEQLAEHMLSRKDQPEKPPRRTMRDWSPTVEILTAILDRLGELTQAVAALGGAKPQKLKRAPVPVTAADRVRNRKRYEKHRSVVARVLPGRTESSGGGGG